MQTDEQPEKKDAIARVGDSFLYLDEIAVLLEDAKTKQDSTNIIRAYANNWVRTQLLQQKAEAISENDNDEIERKVSEYKSQLLIHAYQQKYIEGKLDTIVTEEQINQFYQSNHENFILPHAIVSAVWVKLSNENDLDTDELEKWLQKADENSLKEATDFCTKYALDYNFDTQKWIPFSDFSSLEAFSFKNPQNLPIKRIIKAKDNTYSYFWRIIDVKQSAESAPIVYVRKQIVEIILHQRKTDLQQQLETNLFKQAQENKLYEVFY